MMNYCIDKSVSSTLKKSDAVVRVVISSRKFKKFISFLSIKRALSFISEKKLYSPGPVPISSSIVIDSSHRSSEFKDLIKRKASNLIRRLNKRQYSMVFIQGSGSSAIESVLSSLQDSNVLCFVNGSFGERMTQIASYYHSVVHIETNKNSIRKRLETGYYNIFCYVAFETSKSVYNDLKDMIYYCRKKNILTVIDAVSAFGFYNLPSADFIITSSSKIIGGIPVLGIVFYKNNIKKFLVNRGDYLSLLKYIKSFERYETPHTSLIPQLISIPDRVSIGREEIRNNSLVLCNIMNKNIEVEGERICPVKTFRCKNIKKILNRFREFNIEVYFNPVYMTNYFQVSMFNYSDPNYYKLLKFVMERGR